MKGQLSRFPGMHGVRRLAGILTAIAIAGSCTPEDIEDLSDEEYELFLTALAYSGGLGTSIDLAAALNGGPAGANLDAITWTVNPSSIGSITANGRNATFRGLQIGLATITARHASGTSDDVDITVQPPNLAFIGTYDFGGTSVLPSTDLKGAFRLRYQLGNISDLSLARVEYAVDNGSYVNCDPPSGGFWDCRLNSALVTGGKATYLNGTHVINSRVVVTQGGATATTGTQSVTFNNQDFLDFSINHPAGQTGTLWRGADLTLTGSPIRFSGPVDNLRFGVDVMRTSGSGNVVFNETSPTGSPFTYTINAGQTTAEGVFRFTPRIYDLGGTDVSGSFGTMPAPITTGLDVMAPRISVSSPPTSFSLNALSVRLKYQTGPYAANTFIPLSRINNGFDTPAHMGSCDYRHLHGNITIRNADGTANSTVYVDPDPPDPCGHGEILMAPLDGINFNVVGSVTEPWLGALNLRLYRAVGACDMGASVVDDVPIAQGNAPGESPNPIYNWTSGTVFSMNFRLNTNASMVGSTVCVRGQADDRTINAAGQPNPNRRIFVVQTNLIF